MKILMVSNLFPPEVRGGYEILCQQVAERLGQRGHRVTVLTTRSIREAPVQRAHPFGSAIIRRELRLHRPFGSRPRSDRLRRLWTGRKNYTITERVIASERPDLIFLWSQLRLTVGPAKAAEASGIPFVYTFNDEHPGGFEPRKYSWSPRALMGALLDRWIVPEITNASLALAPSTSISRALRDRLKSAGIPTAECRVIHQGIPLGTFPLKAELGELHEPVRLLYVGQLHHYKGVHTLIEAAHAAAAEGAAVQLTICGTGDEPYKDQLRESALWGQADVCFVGRVERSKLSALYRAHDIFIFPSEWHEPFGLTHLEAMASGLPVISTLNGGQAEFLVDEENALTFDPGEVDQLADCIGRMVTDSDVRARLAVAGRHTVEERFTLRRYVADLERFLIELRGAA